MIYVMGLDPKNGEITPGRDGVGGGVKKHVAKLS